MTASEADGAARNAAARTRLVAEWRPTDRGHSYGYVTINGAVTLRAITYREARDRYPQHDVRMVLR